MIQINFKVDPNQSIDFLFSLHTIFPILTIDVKTHSKIFKSFFV